jgi:hypothetical protein
MNSSIMNNLSYLLLPIGAVIALRILRRKKQEPHTVLKTPKATIPDNSKGRGLFLGSVVS